MYSTIHVSWYLADNDGTLSVSDGTPHLSHNLSSYHAGVTSIITRKVGSLSERSRGSPPSFSAEFHDSSVDVVHIYVKQCNLVTVCMYVGLL